MLIPSLLYLKAKSFADLPVHVCSCLVVAMDIVSFSQFMGARDRQAGNGLVEMSTQSTFWLQVRLLEDDVCTRVLGGFDLESRWQSPRFLPWGQLLLAICGSCHGPPYPVSPVVGIWRGALLIPIWTWAVGNPGVWPWPLFCGHRSCLPHPLRVAVQALPIWLGSSAQTWVPSESWGSTLSGSSLSESAGLCLPRWLRGTYRYLLVLSSWMIVLTSSSIGTSSGSLYGGESLLFGIDVPGWWKQQQDKLVKALFPRSLWFKKETSFRLSVCPCLSHTVFILSSRSTRDEDLLSHVITSDKKISRLLYCPHSEGLSNCHSNGSLPVKT